jgi:hypothetical protein
MTRTEKLFMAAVAAAVAALILAGTALLERRLPPGPHRFGAAGPSNAQAVEVTDNTGAYVASVQDAGGGLAGLTLYGITAGTGAPAPGTPAYNPSWYGYTNIYLDPVSGNDSNAGNTSGAALATCAEAIRRYGSTSPTMNYGQNITWNQLSAVPAGTDPCFFFPRLSGGGYAAYIGTLVPFYSSDGGGNYLLGTVTAASQAGGTDMTIANMPTGTTAGMYVFDSTAGCYSFVESMSGQTGTMTQPLTAASITTIGLPSPAACTMSTGDTATLYNIPSASGLRAFRGTGGDTASSVPSVTWVQWTQIPDSSGTNASVYSLVNDSAASVFSGVYVVTHLDMSMLGGAGNAVYVDGCFLKSTMLSFGSGAFIVAGSFMANFETLGGGSITTTVMELGDTVSGQMVVSGGGVQIASTGMHVTGATTIYNGILELKGPLWGSTGIACNSGCSVYANSGGWAADMLWTGANTFGTATTGSRYVSLGVNVDSIPLTVAAFADAGSIFSPNSGARFTLGQ